ncbi:unnamed protein product [Adineta steineri]|uniref:F-box domain-containing protein n=1 Tax=Adineta steineri TaxID=433720 RepID=A0A816AFV4_9BILA|nr:unnamed protein product [Adineta steineri]CAF1597544.1 unnamed protein product [Adineta steineri]
MNQCNVNLLDLPTEILLIILKKLDNIDVLYSLFDVNNQRLNNIIQKNTFSNALNFVLLTLTDDILSISDRMLDRFCISILPKIHYNVKSLILNSLSMERILLAADYPNLNELKLFKFNGNIASRYFTVKSPFRRIFQQQITDLILVFENDYHEKLCEYYTTDVYGFIFEFFENLKHLSIIELSPNSFPPLLLHNLPSTTCYSSVLYKLCITVMYYDDLLALLDGRIKQLNTLNVTIAEQDCYLSNIYNMNNLPDMKYFYLQCNCSNDIYYDEILPLLHRMSNIEALNLHLTIDNQTTFIDGNHIYNEIIVHMSQLRTFNYYFFTFIRLNQSVNHLSKDDILQTFPNIIYEQVNCMINYGYNDIRYHVFSLPFMFDYLGFIDNVFPSIIFNHVIRLIVDDNIPFEHEFFMRIAWSFPLLKMLCIYNHLSQLTISNKLSSNDNELRSTIIEFPYLISLDLEFTHDDYIEQFLNDKKTYLPHLTKLDITYYGLKNVTENFTNERTRLNCMNVKQLNITPKISIHSEDFYAYFPSL